MVKNVYQHDSLSASVLVLNRLFMAVHIVNARRAFCLLFRELAEVIHLENGYYANYNFSAWREMSELWAEEKKPHEDWIRAVNFEIQVPRVIRLFRYDRLPRRNVRFSRRNLFARDGFQCQYCSRELPPSQLSVDHVVPRSRGGLTIWENVVTCCLSCNVKKGGRTPKEARMKLASPPRTPRHNPVLAMKIGSPKYESWRTFVDSAACSVDGV
jgi:5-methylcytosine-specific restriction endonuclease McrA